MVNGYRMGPQRPYIQRICIKDRISQPGIKLAIEDSKTLAEIRKKNKPNPANNVDKSKYNNRTGSASSYKGKKSNRKACSCKKFHPRECWYKDKDRHGGGNGGGD